MSSIFLNVCLNIGSGNVARLSSRIVHHLPADRPLPRVWTKLSSDSAEALRLWAQCEGVREDDSGNLLSVIARRYVREVYPSKAIRTRADNDKELINLLRVIGQVPTDAILPMHNRRRRRGDGTGTGSGHARRLKACAASAQPDRAYFLAAASSFSNASMRACNAPTRPFKAPTLNTVALLAGASSLLPYASHDES